MLNTFHLALFALLIATLSIHPMDHDSTLIASISEKSHSLFRSASYTDMKSSLASRFGFDTACAKRPTNFKGLTDEGVFYTNKIITASAPLTIAKHALFLEKYSNKLLMAGVVTGAIIMSGIIWHFAQKINEKYRRFQHS